MSTYNERYIDMVSRNGLNLQHIIPKAFTESVYYELCQKAIEQDSTAIQYVKSYFKYHDLAMKSVVKLGANIRHVCMSYYKVHPVLYDELALTAVKQSGLSLQYVIPEHQTIKQCIEAVSQNGYAMKYVIPGNRVPAVFIAAVSQFPPALLFLTEEEQRLEVCYYALQKDPEATVYIKKHTVAEIQAYGERLNNAQKSVHINSSDLFPDEAVANSDDAIDTGLKNDSHNLCDVDKYLPKEVNDDWFQVQPDPDSIKNGHVINIINPINDEIPSHEPKEDQPMDDTINDDMPPLESEEDEPVEDKPIDDTVYDDMPALVTVFELDMMNKLESLTEVTKQSELDMMNKLEGLTAATKQSELDIMNKLKELAAATKRSERCMMNELEDLATVTQQSEFDMMNKLESLTAITQKSELYMMNKLEGLAATTKELELGQQILQSIVDKDILGQIDTLSSYVDRLGKRITSMNEQITEQANISNKFEELSTKYNELIERCEVLEKKATDKKQKNEISFDKFDELIEDGAYEYLLDYDSFDWHSLLNNSDKKETLVCNDDITENIWRHMIKHSSNLQELFVCACKFGGIDLAELLIENGINVNLPNMKSKWGIHYAFKENDLDLIDALEEAGANLDVAVVKTGKSPIYWAYKYNDTTLFDLLGSKNVDLDQIVKKGRSAIHKACKNHTEELVDLLIQHKVDLNVVDDDGNSPLHHVIASNDASGIPIMFNWEFCMKKRCQVAKKLLEAGITHINSKNLAGETPLYLACNQQFVDSEMIALLLEHGADPNVASVDDETPFALICDSDIDMETLIDVATMMLKKGANVNCTTIEGLTPLHLAAIDNNIELVALLMLYGANPELVDGSNKKALHYACDNNNMDMIKLMVE
jgi:ankyrin repeat protein